jgi:hypothetical protein
VKIQTGKNRLKTKKETRTQIEKNIRKAVEPKTHAQNSPPENQPPKNQPKPVDSIKTTNIQFRTHKKNRSKKTNMRNKH